MKKILVSFLLISLFLAGCHKAADAPAVYKTEIDQLIETASANKLGTNSLNNGDLKYVELVMAAEEIITEKTENDDAEGDGWINNLGLPARFVTSFTSPDNSITVNADAEIKLLSKNPFPILRVKAGKIEQKTVDAFVREFLAGVEMVDKETREAADFKLKPMSIRISGIGDMSEIVEGFDAVEDLPDTENVRSLYVSNGSNKRQIDDATIPNPNHVLIGASLHYADQRQGKGFRPYNKFLRRVIGENAAPYETDGELSLTPTQAQEEVNALLSRLGIDYTVTDILLYSEGPDEMNGVPGQLINPDGRYAYRIECASVKSGSPSIIPSMNMRIVDEEHGSWAFWNNDVIDIMMDDDGIFRFDWNAPLDITETVVENAQLMAFDKIENIFEIMMPVAYENYDMFTLPYERIDFTVDNVALGLLRIADKNSVGAGLLVPTWCFYGMMAFIPDQDAPGSEFYASIPESAYTSNLQSLIIINAVDGTIIDPYRGY